MNSDLILTLIFAAVAAFVIFKLRSVLGRRTGHERRHDPFAHDQTADKATEVERDNVVRLPDQGHDHGPALDLDGPAAEGVQAIRDADPIFDPDGFIEGARGAFEMIVGAFAQGDLETLRPLLADDVYRGFEEAVKARAEAEETLETHLVGFKSVEMTDAALAGREARVTVTFVTEQVNVTYDSERRILDGDPNATETVTDIWTFARDVRARDPNWELVETASG